MKRGLLPLGMMLVMALVARGQGVAIRRLDGTTISQADVDNAIAEMMKDGGVPGIALAVLNNGRVVYAKGYGLRDIDKNLPMTVDTVMSGQSLSKAAFAYMVMELVDQGVVELDKPVYQYLAKPLPEYPKYADLAGDARYQKITARMLLSHTSGLPNWRTLEDDKRLKIHFDPGTRYAYSGEGIDLLQLVVENVTNMPLEELMQKYVFEPLQMKHTSMVWQARFDENYANGYDAEGRSLGPQKREQADAASSMETTVGDFARFVAAVMHGYKLKSETRRQMMSAQIKITAKHQFPTFENEVTEQNQGIRLSYGLGWGLFWSPYGQAFFKEGHNDGWEHYAVGFDGAMTGLVIMTNSGNGESLFQDLLVRVIGDALTPVEWEGFARGPVREHKQVSLTPAVLNRYAGRYGEGPLVMTIRREGDHLAGQAGNSAAVEFFAESEKQFFTKNGDAVLTFEVDGRGRATGIVLHSGRKEMVIRRVD